MFQCFLKILFLVTVNFCMTLQSIKGDPGELQSLANGSSLVKHLHISVLNERQKLHEKKAFNLVKQVELQAKEILNWSVTVQVGSTTLPHQPYWTLLPLLEEYERSDADWFLFINEFVSLNISNLVSMLEVSKKSSFVGRSLRDDESSVIHHYAAPSALPNYPDVRAGFLLNGDAIRRAAKKYDPVAIAAANQFVIDTGYEFARWLVENCDVVLEHSEKFCVEGRIADPTLNKDCAVVAHEPRVCSVSERAHSNSDVHVAVKTYSGNHKTRLPVLRRTWLTNAPSFRLYSDITDDTYGTISTGVANTERGHCAKTLVILRLSLQRPQPWQWLLLVDDDTLVSMPRLLKTLSCYSPEEAVVLGEMYGYRAGPHLLVPYPTGGSGIVFSRPMVELLMESSWCSCRVPDEPDDMLLGMCLHRLGHSLVHLRDLHQATPSSYAAGRLNGSNPISFHGFWMIDPVKVYKKWLVGNYEEKPHRNRIVEKVNQATKSMNKDEL